MHKLNLKDPLKRTTFERYYPIPANSQMEIKIDFMPNISLRKKPDLKLSYVKLEKTTDSY